MSSFSLFNVVAHLENLLCEGTEGCIITCMTGICKSDMKAIHKSLLISYYNSYVIDSTWW